ATMIIRGTGEKYHGVKYVNFKIKPCKQDVFRTGDNNKTAGALKDVKSESSLEAVRSQSESNLEDVRSQSESGLEPVRSESVNTLVVKLSDDSTYTYTGYPVKPIPLVTFNDTVLTEGTDYTLSWSKNTDVTKVSDLTDEQDAKKNAAALKIKFKGNMTFTRTVYFKIQAVDWNDITMSLDPSEIDSTSKKAVPVFYKDNGATMITLKKGKAYSVKHKFDKSAGTVGVTVNGAGPYKSTKAQIFDSKTGSYTYIKK
ncbi:MAG: hypothetical protein K6E33_03275, partial [Lachnospiraceae bacterium]|nr:hypothetical protein [Lachnospiraceae bacterium]